MKQIITSESVNCGHPDKTCDIIADSFLDEALRQDVNAQMAVECAIKNNRLFIYGEATTTAKINYKKIARQVLKEIGYTNKFKIKKIISKQSPDINQAVVKKELQANDQGIVFGYATNETQNFMPLPIVLAHLLMKTYNNYRKTTPYFFADAKAQVSVEYVNNKPNKIVCVVVSASHHKKLSHEQVVKEIKKNVVDIVLKEANINYKNAQILINPSGKFTVWGSFSDSGCVGRKIVVDTYGGVGRVGGGCFSSKNATKVDRSAAYYCRYVAKNIVANKLAQRCEIGVSYAIGLNKPLSLFIETFQTEKVPIKDIYKFVNANFNFSPQNMIDELKLLTPCYKQTACFGHFGRDEFLWEKIKTIKI